MNRAGDVAFKQIDCFLRGRFRLLEDPAEQPLAPRTAWNVTRVHEEFSANTPFPGAVTDFLLRMDAKLDAILNAINGPALEEDFPHIMEIQSIGANSLTFTSPLPLAREDCLEFLLTLDQIWAAKASGIGKIVSREVQPESLPLLVLEFYRIDEEDREKIIQYIFTEERRQLRHSRMEPTAQGKAHE